MFDREWQIRNRFWPLFFIFLSGSVFLYTLDWVMGLNPATLNIQHTGLPAAIFTFWTQLVVKFLDTSADIPPKGDAWNNIAN